VIENAQFIPADQAIGIRGNAVRILDEAVKGVQFSQGRNQSPRWRFADWEEGIAGRQMLGGKGPTQRLFTAGAGFRLMGRYGLVGELRRDFHEQGFGHWQTEIDRQQGCHRFADGLVRR